MEETTRKVVKMHKPRKRMKKLLNNVQQQLDFYFSDVNLNHDRFLRKEVEKDKHGYVELSTMLKFNKLKRLTSDVTVLAKAVENSKTLQLSEDRLKVMRSNKLLQLENVDSRTVYVEEFPTNTDHDWLKSIFSICGEVNYISLPKYKHNNQVKGFAFVEFSTADEARKACQVLNTVQKKQKRFSEEPKKRRKRHRSNSESDTPSHPGHGVEGCGKRRRSMSECSSEGGGSPLKHHRKRHTSFCSIEEHDDSNAGRRKKRSRSRSISSDIDAAKVKKNSANENDETAERKMKSSNEDETCTSTSTTMTTTTTTTSTTAKTTTTTRTETLYKSGDLTNQTDDTPSDATSDAPEDTNHKRKSELIESHVVEEKKQKVDENVDKFKDEDEEEEEEGKDEEDETTLKKKKKNRQHKKKEEKVCNDHPKIPPLHVISKNEWMKLKKEYKRLQFTKMSELKKKLKVLKYEQVRREELKERIFSSIAAKGEHGDSAVEKENLEKTTAKMEDTVKEEQPPPPPPPKVLELQAGTVAALKTSNENLTRHIIKSTLLPLGEVAYVDYVDGVYQGFVRFASAVDLDKVIAHEEVEKVKWMFELRKLSSVEEEEYFVTAEQKRQQKYEKGQRKRNKGRGVDKITRHIEQATNHIHFTS